MRMTDIRILDSVLSHPLVRHHRFKFLLRLLYWKLILSHRRNLVVDHFVNECKLVIKPEISGCGAYFYLGLPEFEEMSFLLHFLREGDFFVDIGAAIGAYTVLASAVRKTNTLSVEPNLESYSLLAENIKLNSLAGKVKTLNECLGLENGYVFFASNLGFRSHMLKEGGLLIRLLRSGKEGSMICSKENRPCF